MKLIHVDIETTSQLDLRIVGASQYAKHPSTDVWCVCWQADDGECGTWCPGDQIPWVFEGPKFVMVAHNCAFEEAIYLSILADRYGFHDPAGYRCTQAMMYRRNLPASLGEAAKRLRLDEQKDGDGRALMLKMANKKRYDPSKEGSKAEKDHPENLARLIEYCQQDVRTEVDIHERFAKHFTPEFQADYELDRKINNRGIAVDVQTAKAVTRVIAHEAKELAAGLPGLTFGAAWKPTQTARIKAWLKHEGYSGDDLTAETIEMELREPNDLTPEAIQVLRIRQKGSLGSLAKFDVMAKAADAGTRRLHGTLQLWGASQTGRYAGRLVQVQNLPRPTMSLDEDAIEWLVTKFREGDIAAIKEVHGPDIFDVAKQIIRPMFVADKGHTLVVSDLAQIECRILAWLSQCAKLMKSFADDSIDPYSEMAAAIYNRPADEMGKGTTERQLGKMCLLGCGYGLGADTFRRQTKSALDLDEATSQLAVDTFRKTYREIPTFWRCIENAFRELIRRPDEDPVRKVGIIEFERYDTAGDGIRIEILLPSGRTLIFHDVQVAGDMELSYLNAKNKRKHLYGGKLAENICSGIGLDVLQDRMHELEARGFRVVGHVHDEVILEMPDKGLDTETICQIMSNAPTWAGGLTLAAETDHSPRYTK